MVEIGRGRLGTKAAYRPGMGGGGGGYCLQAFSGGGTYLREGA